MATNKNIKIDNATMTVSADWMKLNPEEKALVKEFQELGYKFEQKQASKRAGEKRSRGYYENNLVEADRKIFALFADEKGRGNYAKAVSFASTVIKLGKAFDAAAGEKKAELEKAIDTYRELIVVDHVAAKLFAAQALAA